MNRRWFVSGMVIFAIAGYVFMAGNQGVQEIILKFVEFSPEQYLVYKLMESIGGIVAVIGLLIALAGIVEKNK